MVIFKLTWKLQNVPYDWIIYDDWIQNGSIQFIKRCTLVSSLTVGLFAGPIKLSEKLIKDFESALTSEGINQTNFKIDNWLSLSINKRVIK